MLKELCALSILGQAWLEVSMVTTRGFLTPTSNPTLVSDFEVVMIKYPDSPLNKQWFVVVFMLKPIYVLYHLVIECISTEAILVSSSYTSRVIQKEVICYENLVSFDNLIYYKIIVS